MRAGPPLLREPERRPPADGHQPPEPPRARSASRLGSASMTIGSSMSSGYCSLDEDLEDCFFTAKTSFFRSAANKVSAKVTAEKLVRRAAKGGGGVLPARGVPVFPHVWLQVLPELASSRSQGRAAVGRKALPLPGSPLPRRGAALLQIFLSHVSPFCTPGSPLPGGIWGSSRLHACLFSFRGAGGRQLPARGPAAGQGPAV